ncbi:cuticle protein AM/CP1114-like [Eriocheir sinensis]|uniref:cuticle protein AM/CP1114-like n=1 Tax=Eriocheir sinensis TaxID=95602 RepID=UPI0021C9D6F5|nr:cuticle protein AM/CP1114-like [Eriocheir sinensis]
MKLLVLACLLAVAAARPEKDSVILKDERSDSGDGNFYYSFETSNGIEKTKTGTPGSAGQSNMDGSFSFTLPDGTIATFTYVADESGYRVESPLLPPVPEYVRKQIAFAEEERARGIVHK